MEEEKNLKLTPLQAAEMGKLWVIYTGNTLGKCVMTYFHHHVEDPDIKQVLEEGISLSNHILNEISDIFNKSHFSIPKGFTDEDVNLDAPRLFSDEYDLFYLQYTGKAGMSIYNAAIPLMTRKDIKTFLTDLLHETVKLLTHVQEVLLKKGLFFNPPIIPVPKQVDFIKKQTYLNGYLGDVRPLHGLEIGHLYDNLTNDVTSKALIVGFSQVAQNKKVKRFLMRGKKINQNHITRATQLLNKENLPAPTLLDHFVSESTTPPFSDKLMMAHKIDMFSMKIRTYANGASLNGRRDIGAMYARFLLDVSLYVEDGTNIMIDHGWMEQPPEALDREHIVYKR